MTPGPTPKPTSTRQRRNRSSTASRLPPADPAAKIPPLRPTARARGQKWHPMTTAWWRRAWRSEMRREWVESDIDGLYMLADLIDAYWHAESRTARKDLAGEIRLQEKRFGLSPMDRRSLQWEVERVETAQARRQPATPARTTSEESDPRRRLRLVESEGDVR